jgi:predicted dehydrogenase
MKNGKVGVGIVGIGFGLSAELPGFRACEGVEVLAVCSARRERVEAAAQQHSIPHAFTDYGEMLTVEGLDLVSIVTPVYLHHPMTVAALEAGKHVLCDKPTAMNVAEAREMYTGAQTAGVIHMIDHELRFNPTRRKLKQMLDEGYIGQLYHVNANIFSDFRADPIARKWDWWSEAEKGGGALGAAASHQIDLLRWWVGEPLRVSGQLGTFVKQRQLPDSTEMRTVTSDDQCSFMAESGNGALASVFITNVARHPQGMRTEFQGERGTLILDAEERLWGRRAGESGLTEFTVPDPNLDLPNVQKNVWAVSFVSLARYLTDCIRAGKPLEEGATFADGLRCQIVLDALRQSWAERRWVDVPTTG